MNHNEMVDDIAHKFIDAGYQVKKNFEYSFKNKGEIDVMALDLEKRVVIMVEVKTHHKPKQYAKAIKQLERHKKASRNLGFGIYNIYKLYVSNEKEEIIL